MFGSEDGTRLRGVITDTLPFLPSAVVDTIMATLRKELVHGMDSEPSGDCEPQSNELSTSDEGETDTCTSPPATATAVRGDRAEQQPHRLHAYINTTMRLEETLTERMNLLTPTEFERILHPIFEEDELTLIIAGAYSCTTSHIMPLYSMSFVHLVFFTIPH